MRALIVDLQISADEYIKRYRVAGASVLTEARGGARVRFPANILQPFVSRNGISGSFRICFDEQGKFQSIEKIAVN